MKFNTIENYYAKTKIIEPFDGIRKENSKIIVDELRHPKHPYFGKRGIHQQLPKQY
jgi:hypothetical protein